MNHPPGMFGPARLATGRAPSDARGGQRQSMFRLAAIRRSGEPEVTLRVRNLSAGGLMADCRPVLDVGEQVEIALPGVGAVAARVAWTKRGRIGLAFAEQIDPRLVRDNTPHAARAAVTILRPSAPKQTRRPGLKIA